MKQYLITLTIALLGLVGCANGPPPCVVTHSPSVKVMDANGVVVSQIPSQITEICPGSIDIKK